MGLIRRCPGRSVLALAMAVGACRGGEATPPPRDPPPPPTGIVVDTATVTLPLSFPAQLYVEHDAAVAARSAGMIDSLLVDIGASVEAGELLATIESIDQELALARAQSAFENSERVVARARGLSQVRGMTVADSEQAEFTHREAGLALRQARRALALTRISAPFAGKVAARYAGRGRLVADGDTLFRVAESGPLLARIRVPEGLATPLRAGANATAVSPSGTAVTARILNAAPAIDAASGTREIVLRLDRAGGLLPGASVTIRIGTERRHVLVVPREAISADGYVLVTDGQRTALRAVVLGSDLGDGRVEVVSGLRAGERLAQPSR